MEEDWRCYLPTENPFTAKVRIADQDEMIKVDHVLPTYADWCRVADFFQVNGYGVWITRWWEQPTYKIFGRQLNKNHLLYILKSWGIRNEVTDQMTDFLWIIGKLRQQSAGKRRLFRHECPHRSDTHTKIWAHIMGHIQKHASSSYLFFITWTVHHWWRRVDRT